MKKLSLAFIFVVVLGLPFLYQFYNKEKMDKGVESEYSKEVNQLLNEMSLEEKVGQMLIPQLPSWKGVPTTTFNGYVEHIIEDLHVGGVIFFDKNIVNIEQLVSFTNELQTKSDLPLFISIDQEGGKSTRKIGTQLAGTMALGATRSEDLAYKTGKLIGKELQALGVNLNFAPVLDINSNPNNPVIGVRSFGDDPQLVGKLGTSYMKGLMEVGIIATVKSYY